LDGAHVAPRTIQLPLTASPCGRPPSRPRSTTQFSSDFHPIISPFSPHRLLAGPTSLRLNRMESPLFPLNPFGCMAGGTNPGRAPQTARGLARSEISAFPFEAIGSATPITFDFGAIFPFHWCSGPTTSPVYASQRPLTGRHAKTWYAACSLGFCRGRHLRPN